MVDPGAEAPFARALREPRQTVHELVPHDRGDCHRTVVDAHQLNDALIRRRSKDFRDDVRVEKVYRFHISQVHVSSRLTGANTGKGVVLRRSLFLRRERPFLQEAIKESAKHTLLLVQTVPEIPAQHHRHRLSMARQLYRRSGLGVVDKGGQAVFGVKQWDLRQE